MINTAYESTTVKTSYRKDIIRPIMIAQVKGALHALPLVGYEDIYLILSNNEETQDIPTFTQPMLIVSGTKASIVVDMRGRGNRLLVDGVLVLPKSGLEWNIIKQAMIMKVWILGGRESLYQMSDLPIKVYSRWVSEKIASTLTLDPLVARHLQVACAWWYICQHHAPAALSEDEYLSKSIYISRIAMVPNEQAYEIIAACGYIGDIVDFCNRTKVALSSPRYQQITPKLLVAALAGSWFSARETAGVAIEYPPTFLAMLHTAINERGFRDTPIAKIAEQLNKQQTFSQFNIAFNQLVLSGQH